MKRGDEYPELFDAGSVVFDLTSANKYDAIREVIRRAPVFDEADGLDAARFADRVIEREKLQSTGFGHGVAVAHGRTPDVRESRIALGVSRDGIPFDSVDGRPVHLLFIVANHPDHQMDYLRILSSVVAVVRNDRFRRELLSCDEAEDVRKRLADAFASRFATADIARER
jgi:PTS system nitrogen regulatory IIA component